MSSERPTSSLGSGRSSPGPGALVETSIRRPCSPAEPPVTYLHSQNMDKDFLNKVPKTLLKSARFNDFIDLAWKNFHSVEHVLEQ